MSKTQVKIIRIQKGEIFPINNNKSYSFRNGSPLINFELRGSPTRLIDTSTIRLNFKLTCGSDLNGSNANKRYVNNFEAYGAVGAVSGTYGANINSRVGVSTVIDTLKLSNLKSNQVIEQIRNYSRLNATLLPVQNSFSNYKNVLCHLYNSFGNKTSQALRMCMPQTCCIPLRSGLFSQKQPLNVYSMGGLKIDISLSPDNYLFNATDYDCMIDSANNAGVNNATYIIEDVSISFDYLVLNQPFIPSQSIMPYACYNSFLQVITSNDSQSSLNLALSSVRSAFQNYIPSTSINNMSVDSLKTITLRNAPYENIDNAAIIELSHIKNGVKYPKLYSVNERVLLKAQPLAFQTHIIRNFINSITSINRLKDSMVNKYTMNTAGYDDIATSTIATNPNSDYYRSLTQDTPDIAMDGATAYNNGIGAVFSYGGNLYGTSVKYDALGVATGTNFRNSTYTVRILSELDSQSPNNGYTFTLSNQQMAVKNMSVNAQM